MKVMLHMFALATAATVAGCSEAIVNSIEAERRAEELREIREVGKAVMEYAMTNHFKLPESLDCIRPSVTNANLSAYRLVTRGRVTDPEDSSQTLLIVSTNIYSGHWRVACFLDGHAEAIASENAE